MKASISYSRISDTEAVDIRSFDILAFFCFELFFPFAAVDKSTFLLPLVVKRKPKLVIPCFNLSANATLSGSDGESL